MQSDEAMLPESPVFKLATSAISPFLEMGASEALWDDSRGAMTVKKLAEMTQGRIKISDLLDANTALSYANRVVSNFIADGISDYGFAVKGTGNYPLKLLDAKSAVSVLYYRGWWDLVYSPAISVVGSRKPSDEGLKRTVALVKKLIDKNFTIVSGLAEGIDTMAHETAIKEGGKTFAVLGTPVHKIYPSQNKALQERLAKDFLIVSQVPVVYYDKHNYRYNRIFFPERNKTMSALTEATIIVEASDTSGTLYQAKAALEQGRKLFILNNCFERGLRWPSQYEAKGAVRVRDFEDIERVLTH